MIRINGDVNIPVTLKRAVELFIERGTYHDPYENRVRALDELRLPANASCMCQDLSEQFVDFIKTKQFDLEIEILRDLDPKSLGLTTKEAELPHTIACVNGKIGVDFTAAQYNDKVAFPYLVNVS